MKTGDKIICIDNSDIVSNLTVGKTYIILEKGHHIEEFIVMMGNVNPGIYHSNRFVSVRKFRKLKLEKLYESNLH